jgi:hypothetical protein
MVMMSSLELRERALRPKSSPFPVSATDFTSMVTSGGDERLAPDPESGRNRYGISGLPSPREIHFSSSTASCISPRGLAAAGEAWRLLSSGARHGLAGWFEDIRRRIASYCERPDVECILSASGTETELLALAITRAALDLPISNIVLAPRETGRGVFAAASGSHFLDSAPFIGTVRKGARLEGWEQADIRAIGVEIRRDDGELRDAAEVDEEVWRLASEALSRGRGVIVHLLDVSKTGRSGLGVETAERIVALAPDRVQVLADCCQLRSSPARMRSLLDRGFLVTVTGSKFAGGPPFSGALLVPSGLLDRMNPAALPKGLRAYSSAHDWPIRVAPAFRRVLAGDANLGLGLRWIAALSEMERFATIPPALALDVQSRFVAEVAGGAARIPGLRMLVPTEDVAAEFARTIVPLALPSPRGSQELALAILHAMREPADGDPAGAGRGFHLGQPVGFGPGTALRVCLSAPMINDVAERVERGENLEAAFAPLAADLRDLFDKWAAVWTKLGGA